VVVVLGALALAAWLVLKLLLACFRLACGRKTKFTAAAAAVARPKAE
jgi:hypothetical protein